MNATTLTLQSWQLLLGAAVLYGVMVVLVRWNVIAKTLRNHMEAEIALVRSRIAADPTPSSAAFLGVPTTD